MLCNEALCEKPSGRKDRFTANRRSSASVKSIDPDVIIDE
jgi:hypothetical protein